MARLAKPTAFAGWTRFSSAAARAFRGWYSPNTDFIPGELGMGGSCRLQPFSGGTASIQAITGGKATI